MSVHPEPGLGVRPEACSWQALGTSAVVVVTDGRMLDRARAAVEEELARIDLACSRFRPDSELRHVNEAAGTAVEVSPLLVEALELALRGARLTDGDVDPSLGTALELAGYDRDWKLIEAAQRGEAPDGQAAAWPRVRALRRPGWQAIELDRVRGVVKVPAGVKLDLGATAKAWAADRAGRAAHAASGAGVLVSLGGDLSVQGPSPAGGWPVHVTDDHRAGLDAPGQRVRIAAGGLATSSVRVRRWRHRGRSMHHLIDPSSGEPAHGPWRTVSVAAGDCADANIASTAALIRGENAFEWLSGLGLPARLVGHDGMVLNVGDWPSQTDERLAA